ncbi:MAG TPA: cystathionine beta-synthase [Nitriliruptorales bacterium]|nr:cystathionine beta-synthase [Nitriliruptorales bacterium]
MVDPPPDAIDVTHRSVYRDTPGFAHDPLEGPRRHVDDRGREVAPDLVALIGDTPLVALRRLSRDVPPTVLAKLEFLNPGGSVKDRIGIAMVEAAEAAGLLRPGGTIVEPTSGNTGVGLAIVAARRGYRCVFVMPDKMSQEKVSLLRAYGAEVVVCPTAVVPDDPRSYYSVSARIARETPGAFEPNQYFNQSNPLTHQHSTGPELWRQTNGLIDVFVAGVGTGGTITGAGRYLKERKREVVVVAADPEGSIYTGVVHPYLTEGIGEDFWPETFDPSVVDRYVRVSDRDAFLMARRCAREEGILVGGSSGTALVAALEVAADHSPETTVVVLVPDSGRNYLSKVYDDKWMAEHGFVQRSGARIAVGEVLHTKTAELPPLVHCHPYETVAQAIALLKEFGVSQMPVFREGEHEPTVGGIIGSIRENALLDAVLQDASVMQRPVIEALQPPLPVAEIDAPLDDVFSDLAAGSPAVVVIDQDRPVGVVTRADLLSFLADARS